MSTPTITNPLSKIGDVIRGSLIAETLEQIPCLFQSVAERVTSQGGKFYIKNFWDDPKPLSLGYVGVHIKIRMPIPPEKTNGVGPPKRRYILLELQLHVKAIMDGTEDCAKEIAHRLYKAPREAGEETLSPEIISSSQLVYLTSMTRLLSSKPQLERVDRTVQLIQTANKADGKMRLVMATAMLLHDKGVHIGGGDWNERLQVIVPKDGEAVAIAWMETARKINDMIPLPIVRMDERDDWTNTATTVPEIYADATAIAPFFRTMCKQVADSQPGCTFNFGPDNGFMIKKQDSLLDKVQADREEELGRFIAQLLQKIGRSWAQITGSDSLPFGRFSQQQNLNFSLCDQLTDSDLRFLRSLSALQSLNLSGCIQLTDECLAHVEDLTSLRSLNLSGCRITDRGLVYLWRLTGLQSLGLYGCEGITAEGMARAGLQSLNLSRQSPGPSPSKPESSQSPGGSGNTQSAKDGYFKLLVGLMDNPSVQSDTSLIEILEREVQKLMDQQTQVLTIKQNKSYLLVQELLADQKVRPYIAKKLREMHPPEESKRPPVALQAQAFSPQSPSAPSPAPQQGALPNPPSTASRAHEKKRPPVTEKPTVKLQAQRSVSPAWITPEERSGRSESRRILREPKQILEQPSSSLSPAWITPEEQLSRLRLDSLDKDLAEAATHWYTALTRLAKVCPRALPKTIPPLPADILQILDSRCPIYAGQTKPDGTPYKIKDTHVLALVPEEFGTLNQLEETILKPYEKANYSEETPLRFRYYGDGVREEHGDVPFARTHWVLMTKDVLPGSRTHESWYSQVALIDALRIKAKATYEHPTLQQSYAIFVTYKVATDKSLYQGNEGVHTLTLVKEMTSGCHLVLGGGSARSGMHVFLPDTRNRFFGSKDIGVVGLRKFPEFDVSHQSPSDPSPAPQQGALPNPPSTASRTHEEKSPPVAEEPAVKLEAQRSVSQAWITPEEQLRRLRLGSLEKDLAAAVTHWHTALTRLAKVCPSAFPKTIPPLPADILQILDSRCPVWPSRKVKDTHVLALVPEEFGSINQLEETILKPYEKTIYPKDTPLRFQYFWDVARKEHGGVPFQRTHWVLEINDALPGSRNKSWDLQVALIDALRIKANVIYEPPTLQQSYVVMVTHQVATGKSLYQVANNGNGNVDTYTRLKEMTSGYHLAIGCSAPSGVNVLYNYGKEVGVVALQKFF